MGLVKCQTITNLGSPTFLTLDINKDPIISICEEDRSDDERLGVDFYKDLTQWDLARTNAAENDTAQQNTEAAEPTTKRKSSLKDTSKTKFPKTPKTKTVRWRQDHCLVTYQASEDEVRKKTEELLKQLLEDNASAKSGLKGDAADSPSNSEDRKPRLFAQPQCEAFPTTPAKPAKKTALFRRCQSHAADNWPRSTCQTGSYNFIGSNQISYTTRRSKKRDCNTLALESIKARWVRLTKGLKAISIKTRDRGLFRTEVFLYEEERNLLVNHEMDCSDSHISANETDWRNLPIDINPDSFHTLSDISPPSRLSWSKLAELPPAITAFHCQSKQCSCHPRNCPTGWFHRLWNWRHAISPSKFRLSAKLKFQKTTNTNRDIPERFSKPGLHSRPTSQILQIRKSYNKLLRREDRKRDYMRRNVRGQETLEVLGLGTGLPVIFEEEEEEEDSSPGNITAERSKMECWRCDSCEECLLIALKEGHPLWKRYEKREHTCCLSERCL